MTIKERLPEILRLHSMWLREEGGVRANLTGADLSRASLYGANLTSAYLSGADLTGAYLTDASLSGTTLPSGVKLEGYVPRLPALLGAGGVHPRHALAAWGCHQWSNCPMHVALGIGDVNEAPEHLRLRVAEFVALFDGKHLEDAPARLGWPVDAACEVTG